MLPQEPAPPEQSHCLWPTTLIKHGHSLFPFPPSCHHFYFIMEKTMPSWAPPIQLLLNNSTFTECWSKVKEERPCRAVAAADLRENVLPPFPCLLFLNLFSGEDSHTVFTQLVLFFLGLIPASAFNGLSSYHGIKYLPVDVAFLPFWGLCTEHFIFTCKLKSCT